MLVSLVLAATLAGGPPAISAPITNLRYEVSFTRQTAAARSLVVTTRFDVAGPGEVLLSLPTWTPGAYEVTNFARWVSGFEATAAGKALDWDKLDYDTWRIPPAGAKQIEVRFTYTADSLDNAMSWSRPDFLLFNGTNVFLYPEGRGFDFPATVTIATESDWKVATGMTPAGQPRTYTEKNFHDLVDMPFFVGAFDYDSALVDGIQARLATYPAGAMQGPAREAFWNEYRKLFAPQVALFGEAPFKAYTTFIIWSDTFQGGSALEHQNSHVGIYTRQGMGQAWIPSITAHEMVHAWNVKRLRPADMVPYRYDVAQPTPWLWVSEGITDYYADVVLARAGIIDSTGFLETTAEKVAQVANVPPVALEDASLSTWIHPTDGTGYVYYPKGSLAGLLLDIMIRDASDNRRSLDDVMRELYRTTYKAGKGFTGQDWWGAVSRAAGGKRFGFFEQCCIDGREPFPYDSVLPLAGLRLVTDSTRVPRIGINAQTDSAGVRVVEVAPDGAAAQAGIRPGDLLLEIGGISTSAPDVFEQFRARFGNVAEGTELPFKVERDGQQLTLSGRVRYIWLTQQQLQFAPNPSPKAVRIRTGILTGR
jgi:predicted metalloprotease with PDZ domain